MNDKRKKAAAKLSKGVMVSHGEEIGLAAGKIWQYLDEAGEASPSRLASATGLSAKEVQRAVGWLAREGKLLIETDGRTELFKLV